MLKKTLSAPLRVYWDLVPEDKDGLDRERAISLAGELAVLKVFFVTLGLSGGARPDIAEVVSGLKKGGVRVTVSISGPDSNPGQAALAAADAVDLRVDGPVKFSGLLAELSSGLPEKKPLSVSFVPVKGGAGELGNVIRLALDAGIRSFNLPNPDIVHNPDRAGDFVLDARERALYKEVLKGLLGPLGKDVRLGVHDLFLHRELGLPSLGERLEYAGCQAGDALAYIDGKGLLYPCASWPVPLGELKEYPFGDIWGRAERAALRARIKGVPSACDGCTELAVCKGGCRGLAIVSGGEDAPDPGCPVRED